MLAGLVGTGAKGHAVGDAVEPGAQAVRVANGGSAFDEDEEGGLEGVVGGVVVAFEHAAAEGVDHGPVAVDESFERGFVAGMDEAVEELGFVEPGDGAGGEQPFELLEHGAGRPAATAGGHELKASG